MQENITKVAFNFETIERDINTPRPKAYLTVSESKIYLNVEATRLMLVQCEYIELRFDRYKHSILILPAKERGWRKHHLYSPLGVNIRLQGKMLDTGMPLGKYIYIGKNVFRHIDRINS